MNIKRIHEILRNKERYDICYNGKPIFIQEVKDNIAKVGFIDGSGDKDVFAEDLYENSLKND